ncbi:MAG: site-2 protease family protein [Candidatus Omnitrophota bacterium]
MIDFIISDPQEGVAYFCMLILAISIHEMAHAWMAYRCGDDTAALMGRLTPNPVAHFDPMGFTFILLGPIGWGKPVPFNPARLKNVSRDSMLIALAGPLSNFIQAVFLALLFRIVHWGIAEKFFLGFRSGEAMLDACDLVFTAGVGCNLMLAFFNLIPLFPLDGEKILAWFLPRELAIKLEEFQSHGPIVLFLLLASGFLFGLPILTWYLEIVTTPVSYLLIGYSIWG